MPARGSRRGGGRVVVATARILHGGRGIAGTSVAVAAVWRMAAAEPSFLAL